MEKNTEGILTKIKKEVPDETIKDYAESAMNELLAWYGYGNNHENTKHSSCHSQHGSNSSEPSSPKAIDECEWCGKHFNDAKALTSSKGTFCSELCFSQSRRANFKKNRMCDWCKHLRHTVSYVDFQDGASQLQFCSDKCLNQYKMHIFCRETRAHLELHPHIADSSEMGGGLITPEMWLKNCKSPDCISSTPNSPKDSDNIEQISPLPLMNTTHSIKLERPSFKRTKSKCHRNKRTRSHVAHTSSRNSPIPEAPQDLRVRQTSRMNNFEPIHYKEEYRSNNYRHKFPHELQNHFMYGIPENRGHLLQSNLLPTPPPFVKPSPLENLMPPVTVLVPYPIIIPLPLPIPIPFNYTDTNKKDDSTSVNKKGTDNQENNLEKVTPNSEATNNVNEHEGVTTGVTEKIQESKGNLENGTEESKGFSYKKRRLIRDQKLETSSKKKK